MRPMQQAVQETSVLDTTSPAPLTRPPSRDVGPLHRNWKSAMTALAHQIAASPPSQRGQNVGENKVATKSVVVVLPIPVETFGAGDQAALLTGSEGWPVLSCDPSRKRPLTRHGVEDASRNLAIIAEGWCQGQTPGSAQ
jgi:hypothetical protein